VDHCRVRMLLDSNPEANIGLTCSFSQEKVMEMQCELLISNFKDRETIARVKEIIGRVPDEPSSHRGGALKLGLEKAFELKKQKRQPPGVLLRCTYSPCAWYHTPVTYSSAGTNLNGHCQNCINRGYGGRYLQCVGCGTNRNGRHASCQSCKRNFT